MKLELYYNSSCPTCETRFVPNFIGKIKECEYETTDQQFEVHKCRMCKSIFLNPRPSENSLNIIYPTNYYSFDSENDLENLKNKSFLKQIFFKIRKKGLEARLLKHLHIPQDRPLRVLDIGCGIGSELDLFKDLNPNVETWGVDFSEIAIETAKRKGHIGHVGRFEEINLPSHYFDVIISLHVIEHVPSPAKFLSKALKCLNSTGILSIATPNIDSLDYKLLKSKHWGGYHTPRHWCLFEIKTFQYLSSSLNFKIFNWTPYTLSSFWVVSFHSLFKEKFGERIAHLLFPPVKVLHGGLYAFLLLSFFGIFERLLLLFTGKANAMWVNIKRVN